MSKDPEIVQASTGCVTFLILVVMFAAIIYSCRLLIPSGSTLSVVTWTPPLADALQMWSVGAAGLITASLVVGSFRNIGFQTASLGYFGLALAMPFAYCTVIYVPTWLLGLGTFRGVPILLYGLAGSALHLPWFVFLAAGEEIGWRGVLTPNLARLIGPVGAGLLSGAIWAVWHYIDILYFDYNVHTLPIYAICCFSISLVGLAMFLTWLRLASGSIWPPALFHGVHNVLIYRVFDRATEGSPVTAYVTTEFGAALAFLSVAIGLISWRLLNRSRAARQCRPAC